MYPETDLPLIKISDELIKEIKQNLPKLKTEALKELMKKGLNEEYANLLIDENKIHDFNELMKSKADINLTAKLLVLYPKEIASREGMSEEQIGKKINLEILGHILESVKAEKIPESSVKEVLTEIIKGKNHVQVIKTFKPTSKSSIEDEIKSIIKQKPNLSIGAYMGLLMQKLKGKADGKELMEILKKHVK
jgi:glutamyl-tRNA(Gln) amidotransferase subunit E